MINLKMNVACFKSECLFLCKDAKKADETLGKVELFEMHRCFYINLILIPS